MQRVPPTCVPDSTWWDSFHSAHPTATFRHITMKPAPILAVLLLGTFAAAAFAEESTDSKPHFTEPYNVVWTSPSHDAAGSMPLGNGHLGINLWVEEDGDLRFYISRNDSFTEVSRLVKIGGVRISLDPNPFKKGMPFRQELKLADGLCEITVGKGKGEDKTVLDVFVDLSSPVVCILGGPFPTKVKVKVAADVWRSRPHTLAGEELNSSWTLHGSPTPVIESADVFPATPAGEVAWYHRNETAPRSVPALKVQSLGPIADKASNPLIHRTFGAYLVASEVRSSDKKERDFKQADQHSLKSAGPVEAFAIRIASPCFQADSAAEWLDEARELASGLVIDGDRNPALTNFMNFVDMPGERRSFWDYSHVIVNGDQDAGIPGTEHPLRIGYDSEGGNRFPGRIV